MATAYEHLEGIADTGDPLDLYADALNSWAHGVVHDDIITLHLSGLLSAKQKATGGVRPLVAGSVHHRIAMRAILAVHKEALIELLGQEQYGMGERAAVEKMFRFVEPAVHEHAENMIMALDMINAFNSMGRTHIMDEVARKYPKLLDTASLVLSHAQKYTSMTRAARHTQYPPSAELTKETPYQQSSS